LIKNIKPFRKKI